MSIPEKLKEIKNLFHNQTEQQIVTLEEVQNYIKELKEKYKLESN